MIWLQQREGGIALHKSVNQSFSEMSWEKAYIIIQVDLSKSLKLQDARFAESWWRGDDVTILFESEAIKK